MDYIKKNKNALVFFALFGVIFFSLQFFCENRGDDVVNIVNVESNGFWNVYLNQVKLGGWSSRFIIDLVMFTLQIKLPKMVWMIITVAIDLVLLYVLIYVFRLKTRDKNIVVVGAMMCMFPWCIQSTAGWIATSVTWWWSVCAAIIALCVVIKNVYDLESRLWVLVLGFFLLIYGADNESCCVFLVVSTTVILICAFVKGRKKIYVAIVDGFLIVRMFIHLYWSINGGRSSTDIEYWFPDFVNLSFFDKIQIGFSTTCYGMFNTYSLPLIVLCTVLCTLVFIKNKSFVKRLVAMFPLLLVCGKSFFAGLTSGFFGNLSMLEATFDGHYGLVYVEQYHHLFRYFVAGLWAFALACIVFCIFWVLDFEKALIATGILGGGYLSRFALGFVPTQYASGIRTHSVLLFVIIVVAMFVFFEVEKENKKIYNILFYAAIFIGGLSYLDNMIYILSRSQ